MTGSINTRGLDELRAKAAAIRGKNAVPLTELFPNAFMKQYTDFSSLSCMLDSSGFEIKSQEDFCAIPDDMWNSFITEHTRFANWEEMLQTAGSQWLKSKLGL